MDKEVRAWKANTDPATRLVLAVRNREGERIGSLQLIDRALAREPSTAVAMTQWRQRFMGAFLTQFEASSERTAAWLERVVLPSGDRMLFLMCAADGTPVGNLGICNLRERSGEVDNVLRGERTGDPRLAYYCQLAMLDWMFGTLGFDEASLHVFSNNERAVRLYEEVGFAVTRTIPLSRRSSPGLVEYLPDSAEGEPVDFSYLRMAISRELFAQRHPWVSA